MVVQPDFFSYSSLFIVIARTDRLGLPLWMIQILNIMFCSMFGVSMAMFTFHFIYRYFVITASPYVKMDSTLKISAWFLTPILYGIVWGLVVFVTLGPNEETDRIVEDHFLPSRHITMDQLTYVGPNYYMTDENGMETLNLTVFCGMAILIAMVTSSVLTIGIFAYKCYKAMGVLLHESNHSEGYKVLQSQLLNMLIVQVTIPAVLMHIPFSILLIGTMFHIGNEVAAGFFCISVAAYPVLDPLPTMFMIQHYRQVLKKIIKKRVKFW
uniref:Seven TM Receptor n=1 Tax=Caenorhabditis tropicalis TaxID=1561998 RepID=A0A1I7SYA3_9PELO